MYRPALLVAAALALAGCGGPATAGESDRLSVVAAFYPLAYAVEQVGGDRVTVASLTKPGGEPHDLELLPRQVVQLREADVVVYLRDFQPVVDAAVTAHASDRAFDVAPSARLLELAAEAGAPADDHGHEEHDGHDHGSVDPHFWLDPTRYADVARAIAVCNDMGMDVITAGGVAAFAMDAAAQGLLEASHPGETLPSFGDSAGQIELLEAIARRQGVGEARQIVHVELEEVGRVGVEGDEVQHVGHVAAHHHRAERLLGGPLPEDAGDVVPARSGADAVDVAGARERGLDALVDHPPGDLGAELLQQRQPGGSSTGPR